MLAAELFSYSLDNYADHVEVGNERFTKLMPADVKTLLTAEKENWTDDQIILNGCVGIKILIIPA